MTFANSMASTSTADAAEAASERRNAGSSVLLTRIAALTRSLDERDRRVDALLQLLESRRASEGAGHAADCSLCPKVMQLEEKARTLQETVDRLRGAPKLIVLGQLATGIAHEINTPIQYVADNFSFLEHAFGKLLRALDGCRAIVEETRPEERAAALENVRRAFDGGELEFLRQDLPEAIAQSRAGLECISKTVGAMRRFSHPSNDAMTDTDLRDIVETTVEIARNEWKYAADMELHFDESLPAVPCIRDEIGRVVLNLVVNAAHAIDDANAALGRSKGRIVIRTRRVDDCAEITVADDGAGIPEHVRERIFDPFFTTKKVGSGTGQGLAMARTCIVEHHRGELFFETSPGAGTTFHIRLPLAHQEEA
ncbi:MAG TPA: ATP-binding protein [Rudaea sp.]